MSVVVYALRHRSQDPLKRFVYVGSTRSVKARRMAWKRRFALLEVGGRPEGLAAFFCDRALNLLAADWDFIVIAELPDDVPQAEREALEYGCVNCFHRLCPDLSLNTHDTASTRFIYRPSDYWSGGPVRPSYDRSREHPRAVLNGIFRKGRPRSGWPWVRRS